MNLHDENILKNFWANSTRDQAEKNMLQLSKVIGFNSKDLMLGIPMTTIKKFIEHVEPLDVTTVLQLVQSKYNEARILGWTLLIRDYAEAPILKYFVLNQAENSNNWNVVDLASPLASTMITKKEDRKTTEAIGGTLILKENIWSIRFAIMLSLPMVQKNQLDYPIKVVDQCLSYEEPIIQQACGIVLQKIGSADSEILNYFLNKNKNSISTITLNEISKKQ